MKNSHLAVRRRDRKVDRFKSAALSNASSVFNLSSTIPSTCSAILSPDRPCELSEPEAMAHWTAAVTAA
jgi:hypothetical protein